MHDKFDAASLGRISFVSVVRKHDPHANSLSFVNHAFRNCSVEWLKVLVITVYHVNSHWIRIQLSWLGSQLGAVCIHVCMYVIWKWFVIIGFKQEAHRSSSLLVVIAISRRGFPPAESLQRCYHQSSDTFSVGIGRTSLTLSVNFSTCINIVYYILGLQMLSYVIWSSS